MKNSWKMFFFGFLLLPFLLVGCTCNRQDEVPAPASAPQELPPPSPEDMVPDDPDNLFPGGPEGEDPEPPADDDSSI